MSNQTFIVEISADGEAATCSVFASDRKLLATFPIKRAIKATDIPWSYRRHFPGAIKIGNPILMAYYKASGTGKLTPFGFVDQSPDRPINAGDSVTRCNQCEGTGHTEHGFQDCVPCGGMGYIAFRHGLNCQKLPHAGKAGMLHAEDDDKPYDVDGVGYCGRCHVAL